MGVVLHKDSKWYQQWKDFKDNNAVFNSEDCFQGFSLLSVAIVTRVSPEKPSDKFIKPRRSDKRGVYL